MGTPLRELLALFDVRVDTKDLDKADEAIGAFGEKLKAAGKMFAEAFAVKEIAEFFEKTIEAGAHVQDLADRLQVGATELKNFGFVALGSGVQFDEAANALSVLERNMGGIGEKGKAAGAEFQRLGVQAKDASGKARPLLDVVTDLSGAFAKLPDQNARAASAQALFGRQGRALLPVLAQGSEKMRAMLKEAEALGTGLGDDYFKKAREAREETEHLGFAFQSIKERITSAALPAIVWLIDKIKAGVTWFLEFTKRTYVVETALRFLGVMIATKMVPVIVELGAAILTAMAPMLPWIAAAAAAYLVYDDLFTLMDGGQSVIGELFDKAEGAGAAEEIAGELRDTWQQITDTVEQATKMFDIFGEQSTAATKDATNHTSKLVETFRLLLAAVNAITGALQALVASFKFTVHAIASDWEGRPVILGGTGKGRDLATSRTELSAIETGVETTVSDVQDILTPGRATKRRRAARAAAGTLANPTAEEASLSEAYGVRETAALPGAGGGTNVTQHIKVENHIEGIKHDPAAVGVAAGQGVQTAVQIANRNALVTANTR